MTDLTRLTNPTQTTNMLELFGDIAKQRQETIQTIKQTDTRIISSDQAFQRSITNLSRQQQVIFGEAQETLNNLRTIGRLPGDLPELLGIFNEKFSPRAQHAKLQSSELELQRLGLQMNTAQQVHRMNVAQSVREQATAINVLQFTREGLIDTQRMAEFGLSLREHEIRLSEHNREVLEKNLKDQSVDTLIQWQADPSKAPKELRDKPGLIRGMILHKSDLETQSRMLAFTLNASEKDQRIRSLSIDQLRGILEGKAAPPDGLTIGEIEERFINQNHAQLTSRSAVLAHKAGELQLRQALKAELLLGKSSTEIQDMLNNMAGETNSIMQGGLEFTRNELTMAFSQKYNEERERNNAMMDRVISLSGVEGAALESGTIAQSLQMVTNPHTAFDPQNPYSMLPPGIAAQAMTNDAKLNQAVALGSADLIIKYNEEQRNFLRQARDAYVDSQPKEVKEATKEFMDNGRFITARNANDYMLNNIGNPGLLGADPVLGPVWSSLTNSYIELAKKQTTGISFDPVSGTVDLTGKGLDSAVLTEEAIRKGNVRKTAKSHLYQEALRVSFGNLVRGSPDVWGKYVNQRSGNLSELFYAVSEREDEGGNVTQELVFNPAEMLITLASDSVALQQKGILRPNDTLIDTLIAEMRTTGMPSIRQIGSGSIGGSALMFSLYGDTPEASIMTEVNALEATAKKVIHEAVRAGSEMSGIKNMSDQARAALNLPPKEELPMEEQIRRSLTGTGPSTSQFNMPRAQ